MSEQSARSAPPTQPAAVEAYRLLIADVYELAGVSRRTSERLAQRVGQTAARWHLMSVVSESDLSVAAAARRLGLARQSVQRVADDLRREGYLRVRPDPHDRRAPLYGLTGSGQAVLAELFESSAHQRADALARAAVTPQDLRRARDTIRAVTAALHRNSQSSSEQAVGSPGADNPTKS